MGHAVFVPAPVGSWWVIFLGYRTHGYLQHVMGRETFLAPVQWEKGSWPVVNKNGTVQINMDCKTLPQVKLPKDPETDDFSQTKLAWCWSYLCNPVFENYSLTERKGYLRMKASEKTIDQVGTLTFIGRRQTEPRFQATTAIDVSSLKEGEEAGITAYAAHTNHYDVVVECRGGKKYVKAYIRIGQVRHVEKKISLNTDLIYLRIEGDYNYYYLSYSEDNHRFLPLGKMEYRYLSTETIGGFTGVHLGLFAQQAKGKPGGSVDVDWFRYSVVK